MFASMYLTKVPKDSMRGKIIPVTDELLHTMLLDH